METAEAFIDCDSGTVEQTEHQSDAEETTEESSDPVDEIYPPEPEV